MPVGARLHRAAFEAFERRGIDPETAERYGIFTGSNTPPTVRRNLRTT